MAAGITTTLIACGGGEPAQLNSTATTVTESTAASTAAPETTSTSSETAAGTQTADAAPSAAGLDPTGAYFAMSELPAEFKELEHLSLATIDENAAPAPLNGFLRPKARGADDYVLVKPLLSGTALTFTTTAVKGVHYSFTGAFQRTGNFAENPPGYEDVALSGTLTKLRDGAPIASTPVNFRYEAGG